MKFWYLFNTTSGEYVAVEARLRDQVKALGEPAFEGHKAPEIIAWALLKQYGGVVFSMDGMRVIEATPVQQDVAKAHPQAA